MSSNSYVLYVLMLLILISDVCSFIGAHRVQQTRKLHRVPLITLADTQRIISGNDEEFVAARAAILAEVDATNLISGKSGACCSDDVCFIDPPATEIGGSRGIGRAIALALAESGCRVIVNYNSNEKAANEVCDEINTKYGSIRTMGIPYKCDVSDPLELQKMVKKIISEIGHIAILVNNAGITRDMLAVRMKPVDFTDVINLNLNGVFYCSQAVFSLSMMKEKKGRIINIASVVGQIGNKGQCNYAASKGGVIGLTRSLAKEYAARGVTVNAVCPGFIESDMTSALDLKKILDQIPLGRLGNADEVAGLVRFLATDPCGDYMTGHCFNIDGGLAIGAT